MVSKRYCLAEGAWNPDGVQCHFKKGTDAEGVHEYPIGTANTSKLCFRNVLEFAKKNSKQSINGATWHTTDK